MRQENPRRKRICEGKGMVAVSRNPDGVTIFSGALRLQNDFEPVLSCLEQLKANCFESESWPIPPSTARFHLGFMPRRKKTRNMVWIHIKLHAVWFDSAGFEIKSRYAKPDRIKAFKWRPLDQKASKSGFCRFCLKGPLETTGKMQVYLSWPA